MKHTINEFEFKNEFKKMTEVFDNEDITDAVKFLRKFSK